MEFFGFMETRRACSCEGQGKAGPAVIKGDEIKKERHHWRLAGQCLPARPRNPRHLLPRPSRPHT